MSETTDVVVREVSEYKSDTYKSRINLDVAFESFFGDEEIRIKLTDGMNEKYDRKHLMRSFNELSEQLEIELELPEEITGETVAKALEPVIGENITVFKSYGVVDRDGEKQQIIYYSLFPESAGIQFPDATYDELFERYPSLKENGKEFVAELSAITPDIKDVTFDDKGNSSPVKFPEGSETLKGVGKHIYDILEDDGGDFAKELQKKLVDYMNGKIVTLTGIVQTIGIWTDKAYDADKLKRPTVMLLADMLNKNSSAHIPMAEVRYTFKFPDNDAVYNSQAQSTSYFKSSMPEDWKVRFHPEDLSIHDFMNIVLPLEQRGLLTSSDAKELKAMDNSYQILGKLTEIIAESGLNAKFRMTYGSSSGSFNYPTFIGLTREEPTFGTGANKEVEPTSEKNPFADTTSSSDVLPEVEPATGVGNVEPSTVASDISDDDLPF